MAVNLTTVRFLAFVLSAAVCCMLIQSAAAQPTSSPGTGGVALTSTNSSPSATTDKTTTTTTTQATTTPTPLDGDCTTGSTNCINNLTCIDKKCGCNTTISYYEFSRQSCVPKKHYGESCDASVPNVCLDSNTNCKNTRVGSSTACLCVDTFYRPDSGQCLSDDNLVITINSVSTTNNSATLTWTDNTRRNNVTFNITSSSSSSTNNIGVGKSNQKVVSGLIAGTEYTFSVTSVLPADDYYNANQKGGNSYKIYTKPSTPVNVTWALDTSRSSESQFVYIATIIKGEGNAASFLFTLVGPGVTSQPVPVPNTSGQTVTTSFTLILEQTYSYTVVAQNNDGNQSQPLYGNYTPRNKVANNVSNVKLTSYLVGVSNPVNLFITWQSGAITGVTSYYIQVQEATDRDGVGFGETTYYHVQGYNNTSYSVPNARAYWLYNVSIMAGTSAGNSSWVSALNRTVESAANNITDLKLTSNRDSSTNKVNLVINWTPGGFTGVTTYYIWVQELAGTGLKDFQITSVAGYDSTSYTLNEVAPFTTYNVSVKAGTSAGNSSWVSAQNRTADSSADSIKNLMLNSSRDPIGDRIQLFISWKPGNYSGETTYYIIVEEATDGSGAQFTNSKSYVAKGYNTTSYTVSDGLLPFWYYQVSVLTGTSTVNSSKVYNTIKTPESAARPVSTLILNSSRDASTNQVNLLVQWEPGALTGMTTYYILVQLLNEGSATQIRLFSVQGYENNNYTVSDVLAFSNYNVSIKAGTSVGNSSMVTKQILTAESCPREVLNLSVTQDAKKAGNVHLMFSCPNLQDRNGTIIGFLIMVYSGQIAINQKISSEDSCIHAFTETIENITVEKNYTFSIAPETKACTGSPKTIPMFIKPLAPNLEDVMKELNMKALVATSSTISKNAEQLGVTICSKCLLDDSQGNVTDVGLIVCVKDSNPTCATYERGKRESSTNHLSNYASYSWAKLTDFKVAYRTTPEDWQQTLNRLNLQEDFVIGENANCDSVSFNTYCNGLLPAGKNFILTVFVCTNGGCSQYQESQVFSTRGPEQDVTWQIAVGVVVGFLLVAVVAVLVVLVIKRRVAVKKDCPEELNENNLKNIQKSAESQGYGNLSSTPVLGSTPGVKDTSDSNSYIEPSDYEYIEAGNINRTSAQQLPTMGRDTQKDGHLTNVIKGQERSKIMFPYDNVASPASAR